MHRLNRTQIGQYCYHLAKFPQSVRVRCCDKQTNPPFCFMLVRLTALTLGNQSSKSNLSDLRAFFSGKTSLNFLGSAVRSLSACMPNRTKYVRLSDQQKQMTNAKAPGPIYVLFNLCLHDTLNNIGIECSFPQDIGQISVEQFNIKQC